MSESVGELGSVIAQVTLVAVVFLFFLLPAERLLIDSDGFKARTHALDNALVADALHALDHGTATAAYQLTDLSAGRTRIPLLTDDERPPAYLLRLEERAVGVIDPHKEVVSARQRFATDNETHVEERLDTPKNYRWVKTPRTLRLDVLLHQSTCPEVAEFPDWSGATTAGDPLAKRILDGGLAYHEVHADHQAINPEATLTITFAQQDRITVQHPANPLGRRLGCLVSEELKARDLNATAQPRTGAGTTVTLPETIDREQASAALTCAYRRLMNDAC